MQYGLIGEKLGHSFSKIIHEKLADYTYDLHPLPKQELASFLEKKEFRAINVTIPYKIAVMPYLYEIDQRAQAVGSVNTIVNRNGNLYGYNTDFGGFLYLLKHNNIDVKNKKVLVLGKGGASKAIIAVLHYLQAKQIITVYYKQSNDAITYEQCQKLHNDADVIINTTPVGMYPNLDGCPIDLEHYTNCNAVVDIIYNPIKTKLLLEAQKHNMIAVGGLEMLIAQAKYAVEIFLNTSIPEYKIDDIYKEILFEKKNVVLIGMPSSGKTTIGAELAKLLHKDFVDIDAQIVSKIGMPISNYFEQYGENAFREIETEVTKEFAGKNNIVISTGGGCIKKPENMLYLSMNGVILLVERDLSKLIVGEGRPLSSSINAIEKMYQERFPLYMRYSQKSIQNNTTTEYAVKQAQIAYMELLQ
ncbi:MAG: shikimate dehydrogenase [Firmicutes bacterium]|nr:shikimate dehydrogenase [Bacillota bacterium]